MPPQQIQRFLDVGYGCEYFGAHGFFFADYSRAFDDPIRDKNQGLSKVSDLEAIVGGTFWTPMCVFL
jgi:hypothetical protein